MQEAQDVAGAKAAQQQARKRGLVLALRAQHLMVGHVEQAAAAVAKQRRAEAAAQRRGPDESGTGSGNSEADGGVGGVLATKMAARRMATQQQGRGFWSPSYAQKRRT